MTSVPLPEPILDDESHAARIRRRIAFTVGCVVCALGAWLLARTSHLPVAPGRGGALLQHTNWPIAIGIAWLVILAGSAFSAIVTSRIHYEGGLFCACVGLALLSIRLGPMRFVLFDSTTGPKIYLLLALELLLLFVAIALTWLFLRLLTRMSWLPSEAHFDDSQSDEALDQKVLALTAQVVVTVIIVLLLARTDEKVQVLAAAFFGSYLAALAAHHFVPTTPSIWYWLGPLVVGLLGYVLQYFTATDWMIGDARGFFAPLARPMPLDYASLGTAGSLLGYWTSRKWQASHLAAESAEAT
jgi:hypothetical protein